MQQVLDADIALARSGARPDLVGGAVGTTGGALIIAGTLLPWFSLYAGLHPLRGTAGLNGRLLLAGGAVAVLLGLALFVRGDRRLRRVLGGLGVGLAIFAAWILLGLPATYRTMQDNPMLVARIGPGVFVAMLGALVVAAAALTRRAEVSGHRSAEQVTVDAA